MLIRYGLIVLLLAIFICVANLRADSPGEVIGITAIESQSQGPMGNKIAVDQFGGVHAVWTKGINGSRPRYVYYNFRSEIDNTWMHPDGTAISAENGTGYVTLDLLGGGETIAAYHAADAMPMHSKIGIDAFRGFGLFYEYEVNPSIECSFPHIARNALSGRLHMITATLDEDFSLQYAYSTDNGETWSDYSLVDTVDLLSYIIVASPISNKTAILYCEQDSIDEFYNLFLIESLDGISWDFNSSLNITGFTTNDSLSVWTDIDAVYDYNDDIHVVYQAAIIDGGEISLNSTQLCHWSQVTDHIVITTGPDSGCAQVANCLCVAKPNIGVDTFNILYAVWSEMDYGDVSAGGFSNGELYVSSSWDHGELWYPRINITNSATPGCAPYDCDSDVWVSLAEKVENYTLHICYIDDNDAGDAAYGQGVWTINAVLYLEFPMFVISVGDSETIAPSGLGFLRAYPNPFNAKTTIEFALAGPGDVELTIYDITGAKVETVGRTGLETGQHSIVWDAKDAASGVYFARMEAGGKSQSIKMVLLK